jgi:phage baseplate assembly protein W
VLAGINNLLPPYIVDDLADVTSPRVLLSGALISVPAPGPAAPNGVVDPASQLGTDFSLTDGLLTADAVGDIATITSYANLAQAIEHRLETRQGELIMHPKYGNRVWQLIGQGGAGTTLQLAAAWAASCIRSDPRVTDASGVTATLVGGAIQIAGQAIPQAGKAVPVGATLGT